MKQNGVHCRLQSILFSSDNTANSLSGKILARGVQFLRVLRITMDSVCRNVTVCSKRRSLRAGVGEGAQVPEGVRRGVPGAARFQGRHLGAAALLRGAACCHQGSRYVDLISATGNSQCNVHCRVAINSTL